MKNKFLVITLLTVNFLVISNGILARKPNNNRIGYTPTHIKDQTDYYDAYYTAETKPKPIKSKAKSNKPSVKQANTTEETSSACPVTTSNVKKLDKLAGKNKCSNEVFDKEVLQNSRPCVVKFTAKWCGPCQQMAPAFEAVAAQYAGKVDFIEIDIDKCKEVQTRFNIKSVPQMHFYAKDKRNKKATKLVKVGEIPGGLTNPEHIKGQVKLYLKV